MACSTTDIWTVLSSLGTVGALAVAILVMHLERKREQKNKPNILLWVDVRDYSGTVTILNSGLTALPIKSLDIPTEDRIYRSLHFGGGSIPGHTALSVQNFSLEPNKIMSLHLNCEGGTGGNFKFRFQLFDGSYKFISINSSFLGPYLLVM